MVGFCDAELGNEVAHGIYDWIETEVGMNLTLPCFYEDIFVDNDTIANVTRECQGHRDWAVHSGGKCITKITAQFQNLSLVSQLYLQSLFLLE